jgi:hypothetical protein
MLQKGKGTFRIDQANYFAFFGFRVSGFFRASTFGFKASTLRNRNFYPKRESGPVWTGPPTQPEPATMKGGRSPTRSDRPRQFIRTNT